MIAAAGALLVSPWGTVEWTALALFLLVCGSGLLALELLVIPGFGVAGVPAVLALVAGVAVAWLRVGPVWGAATVVVGVAIAAVMLYTLPRTRAGRVLVLEASHGSGPATAPGLAALVGRTGIADTPLRPSGTVRVGRERLDAVTDGVFVERGAGVRVAGARGTRIVVEPID